MTEEFPSPYGVSFILINVDKIIIGTEKCTRFRLLTELYSFLLVWNYLLLIRFFLGFRLLTELYSFLPGKTKKTYEIYNRFPSPYGVIFILTYCFIRHNNKWVSCTEFPSPYGVIFILTKETEVLNIRLKYQSFRLLTEYHSFLFPLLDK